MNPVKVTLSQKQLGLYPYLSILFFTAFILLIFLNVVALLVLNIKKETSNDESSRILTSNFKQVYPDLNKNQIKDLWRETASRSYQYDSQTQFRERPFNGKYIHIHESGFRYSENQAPWPPIDENYNVFFFGGSTTFGFALPDQQTIASYLQKRFLSDADSKKIAIYNFGQGAFLSAQERAFFEQLILLNHKPQLALFMDGLNEAAFFSEELHTERLKNYLNGQTTDSVFSSLPLIKLIKRVQKHFTNKHAFDHEFLDNKANDVLERYLKNKELIEKIGEAYGIQTVFIWQPVPHYLYPFESNHLNSTLNPNSVQILKIIYPKMKALYQNGSLGNHFLWLAEIQKNLTHPVYVDSAHYTADMSQTIANLIHDYIRKTFQETQINQEFFDKV